MTSASLPQSTVSPILQHAITLCAGRAVIRERLRVQVNILTRPVQERKALYAELRMREDALTEQIDQLVPRLEPEDLRALQAKYGPVQG